MSTVAADVVTVLQADAPLVALLGASTDIRKGFMQQDGDLGVWVVPSGGFSPVEELGASAAYHRPRVRIYCRVGPRNHDDLEALVQAAKAAIHRNPPSGYTSAVVEGDITELPAASDQYQRSAAVFAALLVIRE